VDWCGISALLGRLPRKHTNISFLRKTFWYALQAVFLTFWQLIAEVCVNHWPYLALANILVLICVYSSIFRGQKIMRHEERVDILGLFSILVCHVSLSSVVILCH